MQPKLNTIQTSRFQQVIEVIETLSLDDQEILLDILGKRLHALRRAQLCQEIIETRQEYKEGKVTLGNVDDFLAALDQE